MVKKSTQKVFQHADPNPHIVVTLTSVQDIVPTAKPVSLIPHYTAADIRIPHIQRWEDMVTVTPTQRLVFLTTRQYTTTHVQLVHCTAVLSWLWLKVGEWVYVGVMFSC